MLKKTLALLMLSAMPVLAFPPQDCPKEGRCFCSPHPAYDTDCIRVDHVSAKTERFFSAQDQIMYTAIHI